MGGAGRLGGAPGRGTPAASRAEVMAAFSARCTANCLPGLHPRGDPQRHRVGGHPLHAEHLRRLQHVVGDVLARPPARRPPGRAAR